MPLSLEFSDFLTGVYPGTDIFLKHLPSFIGLYCGNLCYVFAIQSPIFAVACWVAFLPSAAPLEVYIALAVPVASESPNERDYVYVCHALLCSRNSWGRLRADMPP